MATGSSNNEIRDRFALRKDVMILRQVLYKAYLEMWREQPKESRHKSISVNDAHVREWIDSQLPYFFSAMPQSVLDAYYAEFQPKASEPVKVRDADLTTAEPPY